MTHVAIIGASGYTGIEAATLIARHPALHLVGLFGSPARQAGSVPFGDLAPSLRGVVDLTLEPFELDAVLTLSPDVVLLATPHEASARVAPALLDAGIRVVDLSGAFRLAAADYPTHYGFEHPSPSLLAEAAFGLPEINRAAITDAALVAVAGCYPTSAIIPLHAAATCIEPGSRVIVDSISGVSGAGRGAKASTSFCEVSVAPYAVLTHRHQPEMQRYTGADVHFTPQVGPFDRGIVSTIHLELAGDEADLRAALYQALDGEPFVRLLDADSWPSVAGVRHTNFIDIAMTSRDGHGVIVAAIDNLTKGAAGQGVQCMNIMLGLDETLGLTAREAVPA